MTKRGQRLIDEAYGLDNYLLKTPVNEVYSFLALRIKREILLRLAATSGDSSSSRSQAVASKYQDYVWPREVADWHGLPWLEAVDKLHEEERLADEVSQQPLKAVYRQELLTLARSGKLDLESELEDFENSEGGLVNSFKTTFSRKFGKK